VKIGMFRGSFGIIHRQTCNRKYAKNCFRWIILMSGLQLSLCNCLLWKTVAHCN